MMEITITCENCASAIDVYPNQESQIAKCDICKHETPVHFTKEICEGTLIDCPVCARKDFYSQKDFNRKIGVILFVIAAILSIWTYGISFIVLYLFDFLLFRKLPKVACCYKCQTIFRKVDNIDKIQGFNHEMNDRIIYSDHDFKGQQLEH